MTTIIKKPLRIWSSAKCRSLHKMATGLREAESLGETEQYWSSFSEALSEGEINVDNFSVQECFREFVENGNELLRELDPARGGNAILAETEVKTGDFSNTMGQIIYTKLMESYQNPGFIGDMLTERIPTRFDGEKIAGVDNLDPAGIAEVFEGALYPRVDFAEDYIDTPSTTKYGMIVPVTKEAIFFDRTNLILRNAARVGHALGVSREKRILGTVLGIDDTYSRKGTAAGALKTYAAAADAQNWENVVAGNPLTDWTSLDAGELAFANMIDPATSEPIMVGGNTIVVPRALRATARRIVNVTEVRHGSDPTSISSAPVGNNYGIVSNEWVSSIVGDATSWFQGDFQRAFAYMENWPITVVQAPTNAFEEFNNDITAQYKCSERGTPAVLEPMYVVKHLAV